MIRSKSKRLSLGLVQLFLFIIFLFSFGRTRAPVFKSTSHTSHLLKNFTSSPDHAGILILLLKIGGPENEGVPAVGEFLARGDVQLEEVTFR